MKLIFSMGIVALMILSIFGIYFSNPDARTSGTIKYGDYKFKITDGAIIYDYDGNDLIFYNDPNTLEFDLEFDDLIIAFDPNMKDIQYFEVGRKTLEDNFAILGANVIFGVTEFNEQYFAFPQYDCNSNVTGTKIIVRNGNEEVLKNEGNCYVFETYGGRSYLRLMDYIALKKLGVYDGS